MSANGKSFGPILRRAMGLEEKRANHVGDPADHWLSMAILLRGVRTSEPMKGS